MTSLFWRFHNQIFLNNCWFYGRQKVHLSVTALAMRRSFTGFAGKLPSSSLQDFVGWGCVGLYPAQNANFHCWAVSISRITWGIRLCHRSGRLKARFLCTKAHLLSLYWSTGEFWSGTVVLVPVCLPVYNLWYSRPIWCTARRISRLGLQMEH